MGGIMKLCNKDVCLAMCQMGVLDIIFNSGATMDLEQAIIQLGLNDKKYIKYAEVEGLPKITDMIKKVTECK